LGGGGRAKEDAKHIKHIKLHVHDYIDLRKGKTEARKRHKEAFEKRE
jgi:hypothetical protein